MQNSLAIIGAGRVGRALGRRLRELGWKIGAVVTRSEASERRAVRFIGAGKACAGLTRQILASRVVLIATNDDEIAVVAQELARIGRRAAWENRPAHQRRDGLCCAQRRASAGRKSRIA